MSGPKKATADSPKEESAEEELARYLDTIRQSLAPLRPAREGLKHLSNIEAAGAFASVLNKAFAELKGGLK